MESGRASDLRYSDAKISDRTVTLTLADPVPPDLLGQDRKVRSGSRYLFFEVTAVLGDEVTLRSSYGDPALVPSNGVLEVNTDWASRAIDRQRQALDAVANLRRHLGAEVTQKMIDPSSYVAAQRVVSIAKLRRDGLARKAAMVAKGQLAPDEAPDAQSVADAAVAEQAAVRQIENAPSRPASVYEKAEMLERALSSAKTRLSISSKGLAPHIVDKAFIAHLTKRIQAGVAISISLHEDGVKWGARKGEWSNAYAALQKLSQTSGGRLKVRITREERYYHLAWDDEFALVCNRPILSNPGRIRTFEQFAGYILQDRALIQSYLDRVNR